MEPLHWENLDKINFNIFIRDLSQSINVNLKYMIEDLNKSSSPNKHKGQNKKQIIKKKI